MSQDQNNYDGHAWFTLSGDVNSDMVRRVFDAVADMTEDRITTAHILIQSNGGYVSDGICLYNYLSKLPIKIVTYNAGAVASIAVILFLAGAERYASDTARFMVHKSHASAPHGARPDALRIIVEGPHRADPAQARGAERGTLAHARIFGPAPDGWRSVESRRHQRRRRFRAARRPARDQHLKPVYSSPVGAWPVTMARGWAGIRSRKWELSNLTRRPEWPKGVRQ